jgi:ferric-dicitrate binding protein FerR (iron transport regulator)
LTRKHRITDSGGLRGQATYAARQFGPFASKTVPMAQQAAQQAQLAAQQAQLAAQQAVPFAKSAGESVRHSADGALAWATPKVDAARAWAAPQLESSARMISESLAPAISTALMNAARKVDAPVRKRPRRRGLVAGVILLVAAAAGAAAAMWLRQPPVEVTSVTMTEEDNPPDPDMNGHSRIV